MRITVIGGEDAVGRRRKVGNREGEGRAAVREIAGHQGVGGFLDAIDHQVNRTICRPAGTQGRVEVGRVRHLIAIGRTCRTHEGQGEEVSLFKRFHPRHKAVWFARPYRAPAMAPLFTMAKAEQFAQFAPHDLPLSLGGRWELLSANAGSWSPERWCSRKLATSYYGGCGPDLAPWVSVFLLEA